LYAVVIHAGSKLDGGHYFTYARESDSDLTVEEDLINAPWTRYDDTRISRTSWKSIKEDTRASLVDTAYMLFYRRLNATESSKLAKQRNSGVPPVSPTPSEHHDVKDIANLSLQPSFKAKEKKEFVLSPALTEMVSRDNSLFLTELMQSTTAHYLQALSATVRAQANFTGPFHVQLLATADKKQSVLQVPVEPSCSVCLAPLKHHTQGDGDSCPFAAYQIIECSKCMLAVSRAGYEAHSKTCVPEVWPGFGPQKATQSANVSSTNTGTNGNAIPQAPDVPAPPDSDPPMLERATSLFVCESCHMQIAGFEQYMVHHAECVGELS
jgi:hypothetical protein